MVMATLGELFPGVRATAADPPAAAVVKGDIRMAGVVAAAVRDRQRVPDGELVVELDGLRLRVPHETCARHRARARAVRLTHNMARKLYVTEMLKELARAEARALEEGCAWRRWSWRTRSWPGRWTWSPTWTRSTWQWRRSGCGRSRRCGRRSTRCGRS
ncbi:hypothetical protein ACFSTC_25880 [Nonomuraea ferruginea]